MEKMSSEFEDNTEKVSLELEQWLKKMKCNGFDEKEVTLEHFQGIQVGVLDEEVSSGSPSFESFPDMKKAYEGDRDGGNRYHGSGSVQFEDGSTLIGTWDHGLQTGFFKVVRNGNGVNCIKLHVDDTIEGDVKIKLKDNTWIAGVFKGGILHGFCRCFNAKNRLTFIGMHENGKPIGTCWKIIEGGGCVVGRVDKDGELSGPDIAYIYPDFRTSLVGVFDNGVMVCAQHCSVINVRMESGSIKVPIFSEKTGSVFKREVSTDKFVTSSPTLKDPYETNTIKVRTSKVPGASEGIFARSDILENTILAFYNGIKLPADYEEEDTWEANSYKIFDPSNKPDGALDILEKHRSTTHYRASLAHKTNHSFLPNSQFLVYDHPRWGLVPCIASTQDIKAGEEIFVRYGYDLDLCPDWYTEAWNTGSYEVIEAKNTYFTLDDL